MKKRLFAYLLLLCSVVLFSCNRPHEEYSTWGQTEHYSPFLWHRHTPDTLRKSLRYEFNEDAAALTDPIVFSLYMTPEDSSESFKADPKDVELYVDGVLSPDNTFSLKPEPGAHEIEFGVVLTLQLLESMKIDRDYQFVFKVEHNPGIDRINDFKIGSLKESEMVLESQNDDKTPFRIRVERVSNALKVGCLSTLFTILALLIAFIIIVQLFIKRFNQLQLSKIYVTIDENRKNITRMQASLTSAKEIVLTPVSKSQNFLKMLFFGKVAYVVIKGLPSEVKLTPGSRAQTNAQFRRNDFSSTTTGDSDEIRVLKYEDPEANRVIQIEYCVRR